MKYILSLLLITVCLNTNAQRHYKAKLPPIPYRCTVDITEGKQCPNWSKNDSEYCWKHADWRHKCDYKNCPYKGKRKFKVCCKECKINSDWYILDKIHFHYPHLSYDECEDVAINNPDLYKQL